MFKKSLLAIVIAFCFALAGFAKTSVILNTNIGIVINNDELVNELAADADFIKYYLSNVEFANKIVATKSGALFLKYIQKNATEAEQTLLFKQMKVADKKEFDGIALKLQSEAVKFSSKFPQLEKLTQTNQKEVFLNTLKKINSRVPKFSKAFNVPTYEECFWTWLACESACFILCSSQQGNQCYWDCSAVCTALGGICWLAAE